MLGIRLSPDVESALDRHARGVGRPKSVIVRDWIVERLERESVDAEMARAAKLLAQADDGHDHDHELQRSAAMLRWLDEEDGGYDWGPEGPPS